MLRQGCDAHAHTHLCACTYLGVCTQVSYLQFKVNSKSSREFDSDGAFGQLSSTLRREIREEMFKPILKEVKLFGHSQSGEWAAHAPRLRLHWRL
jgi:hypothetical protein